MRPLPDRRLRVALWSSVVLNALGVLVFAPATVGRVSPLLPIPAPPFFAAQVGFVIALFGGVYLWLVLQPRIPRPLVVVGGLGKLGFFVLTVVYALAGEVPPAMALQATPDLILAVVFLRWAAASR